MRQIIKKNLKELGFSDLSEAEDGAAGLKKAGEEPVDLIVSDWNMPNMTGLEFLKAVRADDKLKGINFIMVTSEADKEKIMEAVQAGVNQYIVKPFNAMQLEEKIKAIKM
jgi:two-component system chemotaxis response regulator CheY